MVRVEVDDKLAEKVREYGRKRGFKTLSAAIAYALNEYFERIREKDVVIDTDEDVEVIE